MVIFPSAADDFAVTADSEAMFRQVKVLAKDADALRFVWWSGLNDPPDEYQMLVHIFGATSSPCCANKAVHQTADDNEDQFDPEVTRTGAETFTSTITASSCWPCLLKRNERILS